MADVTVDDIPPPPQAAQAVTVDDIPAPKAQPVPQTSVQASVSVDDIPAPDKQPQVYDLSKPNDQPDLNAAPTLELNPQENAPAQPLAPEQQKTVGAIQGAAQSVSDFGNSIIKPAFQTLQVPAQMVGYALAPDSVVAAANAARRAQAPEGSTLSQQYKAFLDNPVYLGDSVEKYFEKTGNYIADKISPNSKDDLANRGLMNGVANVVQGLTPFVSHMAAMGVTAVTDPAMLLSLGASQFNTALTSVEGTASEAATAMNAAELASGASKGELAIDSTGAVAYTPSSNEYVASLLKSGQSGKAGASDTLATFTIPGTDKPFIKLSSQAIKQTIDKSTADFMSSSFGQNYASKFSANSGFPAFDELATSSNVERYGNVELTRQASDALAQSQVSEKVVRHATIEGEFPTSYQKIVDKMGLPELTPDELILSRQKQAEWSSYDLYAGQELQKAGVQFEPFKPADLEYQNNKINGLLKSGTISEHEAELFREYGFSEDRGFGRQFTDQASDRLREIDESAKIFGKGQGLKITTGSLQEREKLSTLAMNAIKGRELGIAEPFNPNTDQVVIRNFSENLQLASDAKFVRATAQNYGATLDGWAQKIHGANQSLALDASMGMPSSRETMMHAGLEANAQANHLQFMEDNPQHTGEITSKSVGLNTDKFSQMPGAVWDKFGENFLGEGGKELYYPNSIVEQVQNRFNRPSGSLAYMLLQKQNTIWAQNALTTTARIGLDSGTSAWAFLNQRGDWSQLAESMLQNSGLKGRDTIGQLFDASPLKSSYLDLFDKSEKAYLDLKMLKDPLSHQVTEDVLTAMQGVSKQHGSIDKLVDTWKQAIGAGRPIDYAALPIKGAAYATNKALDAGQAFNDLALFKKLREAGPALTNVFKEGYFRTLIDRGVAPSQAIEMARSPFLDFSNPNASGVDAVSKVVPFFGFQWKAMVRIPQLLLERPGVSNIINPYSGYLKKAFEDWSGYTPQDSAAIQQVMPGFPHGPVLGPVLYGTKEMIEQKDLVKGMLNQYAGALAGVAGQAGQVELAKGYRMMWRMPSPMSAGTEALNALNPLKAHESGDLTLAPYVKAGLALTLGIDPFSGDKLKFDKAPDMYMQERVLTAIGQMNPLNFNKIYNGMIRPVAGQLIQANADYLRNMGEPKGWVDTALGTLYGKTPRDQQRISESAVKSLANMGLGGLGYLTNEDLTYRFKQESILRDAKDTLRKGLNSNNSATTSEAIESYKFQNKMLERNARAYLDFKARNSSSMQSLKLPVIDLNPEGMGQ